MTQDPPETTAKPTPKPTGEERLATKLRENLHRRKQQARAKEQPPRDLSKPGSCR